MKPVRFIAAWLLGGLTIGSYFLMKTTEGNAHDGWKALFICLVIASLGLLAVAAWLEEFP